MPDGQDNTQKTQLFYQWLSNTYGYIPAQYERFKAGHGVPFTMAVDETSPLFRYFDQYVYPAYQQQQQQVAREQELTSMLPTYRSGRDNALYSVFPITGFEDQSYTQRLSGLLNQMVYKGAMKPDEAERYYERSIESAAGGVPIEQLPYFNELQRPDFRDWQTWYVGQVDRARRDESTKRALVGQLTQGMPTQEIMKREEELGGLSVPELEYELELRDWRITQAEQARKETKRQAGEAQMRGMEAQKAFGEYETGMEQLRASARAAATPSEPVGTFDVNAIAQAKFQELMSQATPATAEQFTAMAPSPAQAEFYGGAKATAQVGAYNQALAEWNWTVAQGLAQYEQESASTEQWITQQTGQNVITSPYESEMPSFPAYKQFPSLETWAGKFDWYKEFLATPPEQRPGGTMGRKLTPRAKWRF